MTTKQQALDRSRSHGWKRLGIKFTLSEYNEMLKIQKGVCAVCKEPPLKRGRRLGVDHDHRTGIVRALLCARCNRSRMGSNTLQTAKRVVAILEHF